MTERKLLSLCMITRNNEKDLRDCIEPMKAIADEIIIADIGSSDETVAIARQEGAIVYNAQWHEDFSEIKNLLLEKATGRWILFLQPNEYISQPSEIKPLLDNPNAEGYLIYVDHNSESYSIFSPVQSLRLIRNRGEYKFKYKAFELIPEEQMTSILDSGIKIVCREDAAQGWELRARLTRLLDEAIENDDDSYLQYQYGIMLLNQNRIEESLPHFQKARNDVKFGYWFVPHLYKCLSWALLSLERYSEAVEVLGEGVENFSFYTDLLILRAEAQSQLKQYSKAAADLEGCLKIREQPIFIVPSPEIDDCIVFAMLGEAYEQMLDYRQALACFRQAYELDGSNEEALYKIKELSEKSASQEPL